jgi:hypothetical protein
MLCFEVSRSPSIWQQCQQSEHFKRQGRIGVPPKEWEKFPDLFGAPMAFPTQLQTNLAMGQSKNK